MLGNWDGAFDATPKRLATSVKTCYDSGRKRTESVIPAQVKEGTRLKKFLLKLEVSRKQDYIFSSKRLRDNAARSAEIDFVTGHLTRLQRRDFFREAAENLYDRAENLVYSGGGHAVLQFDDEDTATEFARRVTKAAMERFRGMELFVKRLQYDENILGEDKPTAFQRKTGAANLRELSRQLEEKKALRRNAVGQVSFGVEKMNPRTFQPEPLESAWAESLEESAPAPDGCEYPSRMEHLCGEDNFIAAVHIDGNGMGTRVNKIYDKNSETDWDGLRKELAEFSETVDKAFKSAFRRTAEQVAAYLEKNPETLNHTPKANQSQDPPPAHVLPIRPVILAGDDVCFVTMGSIGLECARLFLENLRNPESGEGYYACAGVALVHRKYPFHKAYQLSEELCSNAKKFVAEIRKAEAEADAKKRANGDAKGETQGNAETKKNTAVHGVSALDWHIEFGQLRGDLDEIRRAYETEDRDEQEKPRRMELRPVVLLAGDDKDTSKRMDIDGGVCGDMTGGVRTYDYFKALCQAMRGEYGQTARGKIKDLRTAFKQGAVESSYFLRSAEVSYLLYQAFHAQYRTDTERWKQFNKVWGDEGEKLFSGGMASFRGEAFKDVNGVSRCLFFDAVEMIDHFTALGIGEEAET